MSYPFSYPPSKLYHHWGLCSCCGKIPSLPKQLVTSFHSQPVELCLRCIWGGGSAESDIRVLSSVLCRCTGVGGLKPIFPYPFENRKGVIPVFQAGDLLQGWTPLTHCSGVKIHKPFISLLFCSSHFLLSLCLLWSPPIQILVLGTAFWGEPISDRRF